MPSIRLGQHSVSLHRGFPAVAPEESRASYRAAGKVVQRAAQSHPDARRHMLLEGDLHLTKDGALVVHHDRSLGRTTDIASRFPDKAKAEIADLTADEVTSLNSGSWFNKKHPRAARDEFDSERILRLDDLMDEVEAHDDPELGEEGLTGVTLEIKGGSQYVGIERLLIEKFKERGWLDEKGQPTRPLEVQAFDGNTLSRVRAQAPAVPLLFLTGGFRFNKALEEAQRVGADTIAPNKFFLTPGRVKRAHAVDLEVRPFTVDSKLGMRLVAWMGVDGWFTNRVDRYLKLTKTP